MIILYALGIVVLGIVIVVMLLLIFATTRPDTFAVSRSAVIKAPPEAIFPLIDDFHRWTQWSPYENRDPALQRTYGGASHGQGATYAWTGNRNVGSGRMEILQSEPSRRIVIKLDFISPFEAHNVGEFTLEPEADGTRVTWAMRGPVPLIGRLMHAFMDIDKMVGTDFATGLANIKTLVET